MPSPRIALVTCRPQPEYDRDLPVLARAVARAGADVHVVGWDDPDRLAASSLRGGTGSASGAAAGSPSCARRATSSALAGARSVPLAPRSPSRMRRIARATAARARYACAVPYDADKIPHPDLRPWEATAAELDVAARALQAVPDAPELLYARVDLVDGPDGDPLVMELELVEPNLFLAPHPGSLPHVVEHILKAAV